MNPFLPLFWIAIACGLIELFLVRRGYIQGIPDEEKKE